MITRDNKKGIRILLILFSIYQKYQTFFNTKISFENTGNDTAYNIYIIDSLSNYLDPQSLRLEIASAKMTTTRINVGGQNIVKFEFPNINLLDSSHHGLCDGNLKFNINTKPGLPIGTTINNHVGIYFDYNPVVMTNTVTNYMSNTQVPLISTNSKIDLFPNPANTTLTIKTSDNTYNSFTISNIIGVQMIQQSIIGNHTNVDVAKLPNGVYYVTFKGETGDIVKKFVKM